MAQELINVFSAEVFVDICSGSGSMMKGVLKKNIRGVSICRTQAHKSFQMKQLIEFVKVHRLVNVSNAPEKPAELIDYEKVRFIEFMFSRVLKTIIFPGGGVYEQILNLSIHQSRGACGKARPWWSGAWSGTWSGAWSGACARRRGHADAHAPIAPIAPIAAIAGARGPGCAPRGPARDAQRFRGIRPLSGGIELQII